MSRPPLFEQGKDPITALAMEILQEADRMTEASTNQALDLRTRHRLLKAATRRKDTATALLKDEA